MDYKVKAEEALQKRSAIMADVASIEDVEARSAKEAEAQALLDEARGYFQKAKDEAEAAELRSSLGGIKVVREAIATPENDDELRNAIVGLRSANAEGYEVRSTLTPTEARANIVSGGSQYGNSAFVSKVLSAIYDRTTVLKAGASVISTTGGALIEAPVLGNFNVAQVAEGAAIPETDAVTKKQLSAFKYGTIALVSHEMLEDAGSNVVDFVARAAAQAVKNTATKDFLSGDGVNKPAGALASSTKGADAAAAAITESDVYELYYSVDNPDSGTWVMHPLTAAAIRSLSSGLWSVNPGTDNPNLLLGRPVIVDSNMPQIGTGNKSVLFGDFSAYYVRQVNGLRIERSDDYKFGNDLVAVRVLWRADGVLTDVNAVKHLKHA